MSESSRAIRFIGLNTEDRIGMLRRAWNKANITAATLLEVLNSEAEAAHAQESDDIQSSASNSHSSSSQQPGAATAAAAEKTRGWYQIIEGFQTVRQFLRQCAKYGLDAFAVKCQGQFPNPLPALVQNPVTLDTYGKWDLLCDKYGDQFVTSGTVIGDAVNDGTIYLWLLDNPDLLNITKGITEQRGDYTESIIGRTGGIVYA